MKNKMKKKMKKYCASAVIGFMIMVCFFSIGAIEQAKIPAPGYMATGKVKVDFNFGNVPLYFISNKGQVNREVRFYAQTSQYTLWLTKEGLVFDHSSLERPAGSLEPGKRDVYRLLFIGANKNPGIKGAEENKLQVNYFKGKDKSGWYSHIPTSRAVVYKDIYKNIDLRVYGMEKQIEYDWIIKPGGNPGDICFEYQEAKKTQIDHQGNVLIESGVYKSLHKRPIGFQIVEKKHGVPGSEKKVAVAVEFKKISENRYGLAVGDYDKNSDLIIDPAVLTYSTYLGGKQADVGLGIAVDSNGYTYAAGMTWSTDFPIKGQYQSNHGADNFDAFVVKLDTTGSGSSSLIYATFLGGANSDNCTDLAVDNSGKVYLTGQTWSEDFPAKNAYQTYKGDGDAYVAKLDTTLTGSASLIYCTYLGGTDNDSSEAIAIDNKGNAYIAGSTYSLDFPLLNACDSVTSEDCTDGFAARIDTTRSGTAGLIYSTYLGGLKSDKCLDIAVDGKNCAYITGWTYSSDFPTKNRYQAYRGYADAFATKIDTSIKGAAGLIYSSYLGGGDSDYGQGIAVDAGNTGYIYVTGITMSTNYPTLKSYQKFQGNSDAFISKIDITRSGTASLIYSTYLGGNKIDKGSAIALDPNNGQCVYVTGVTRSSNFPTLKPYQTSQGEDNEDAFISKIDTSVSGSPGLLFSTYLGGNNSDGGSDIAVDDSGNVFVTGWTYSTNFPTVNQYKKDPGDMNNDVFITRLLLEPDKPPAIQLSRTAMTFSALTGGGHTGSQTFSVNNSGDGNLNWTASASDTWLSITPSTGAANDIVSVSIAPTGLTAGNFTGTITISDPEAENSPQTVTVTLTVHPSGSTNPPFGDFSTPVDGSTVSSSIAVTGWVLDDIGVESVKIYRLEGESSVYIGDALFVEGARPDIETAYPNYPMNYRAGWGYMLLTHFLPAGGNGTFTLQAVAIDAEGQQTILGLRAITADNAHAVKPFGAIDTPTQGGIASGNKFTNWGWVLTPMPAKIPTNGSTINVWIDGVNIGHPTYNVSRPDIAALFTNYANSSGAGGYFNLDTTAYPNGIHIIFWTATDDAGNSDGIGSRYFSIRNTGTGDHASRTGAAEMELDIQQVTGEVAAPLAVKKGFNRDEQPVFVYPDHTGATYIKLKELERVEIHFPGASVIKPLGLQIAPGCFRPLPVGSSLDRDKGIFYWQPGPGFVGRYRLVFAVKKPDGNWKKKNILLDIVPK